MESTDHFSSVFDMLQSLAYWRSGWGGALHRITPLYDLICVVFGTNYGSTTNCGVCVYGRRRTSLWYWQSPDCCIHASFYNSTFQMVHSPDNTKERYWMWFGPAGPKNSGKFVPERVPARFLGHPIASRRLRRQNFVASHQIPDFGPVSHHPLEGPPAPPHHLIPEYSLSNIRLVRHRGVFGSWVTVSEELSGCLKTYQKFELYIHFFYNVPPMP